MSDELKNGISVVIPAHGDCDFLVQTICSLEASSRRADEVLLINDGINPLILQVVNERYPHIQVIPNLGSGLVDALNTGLEQATFDLVARIDADDCVTEQRFQIQEDFMRSNQNVVLCGTQVTYISSTSKILGASNYNLGDITAETRKGERCLLAHPSVMYRTSIAKLVGGYRKIFTIKNVNLAEDYDLWVRLSRVGQIVNLEQFLTLYRQHPTQLSIVHRGPQEIASYFIRAVSLYENTPGNSIEPAMIKTYAESLKTVGFVRSILGIREGLKYRIEIMSYFEKLNPLLRKVIIKIL